MDNLPAEYEIDFGETYKLVWNKEYSSNTIYQNNIIACFGLESYDTGRPKAWYFDFSDGKSGTGCYIPLDNDNARDELRSFFKYIDIHDEQTYDRIFDGLSVAESFAKIKPKGKVTYADIVKYGSIEKGDF